jgi:hypothetical protein
LMWAAPIALAHFAVSSTMNFPKIVRAWFTTRGVVQLVAPLGDGLIGDPPNAIDGAQRPMLRQRVPRCKRKILAEHVALGRRESLFRHRDRGDLEERSI